MLTRSPRSLLVATTILVPLVVSCDFTRPGRLDLELDVRTTAVPGGAVEVLVRAKPDSGDRIASVSRDIAGDVLTFPGPGPGGEGLEWGLISGAFLPKRNGAIRISGSATTTKGLARRRDTVIVLADTTPPRASIVFAIPSVGATIVPGDSVQISYSVFDDVEVKTTTLRVAGAFTYTGVTQTVGSWAAQIYSGFKVPANAVGSAVVTVDVVDWEGRATRSTLGSYQVSAASQAVGVARGLRR